MTIAKQNKKDSVHANHSNQRTYCTELGFEHIPTLANGFKLATLINPPMTLYLTEKK